MSAIAYGLPAGIGRAAGLLLTIDDHLVALATCPVATWGVCASAGPAQVVLAAPYALAGTVIRPDARGLVPHITGNRLTLTVDTPGPLTLETPGQPPLHLFIQPVETEVPDRADPHVRWLEAGRIHELGEVRLADGETLYLEGGAVLRGWIRAKQASGVRIRGHGVIDGSGFPHHSRQMVVFDQCHDARIDGPTIIGSPSWTIIVGGSDDVVVRRVNLIGWVMCSDGIDVVGSHRVTVEDCFLRDNDDCVAIKAVSSNPAWSRDVEDVLVQRCVCWNDDAGNVFEIGFETCCDRICRITFRDCDVINAHGDGGVFTIHAGDHALIEDVLYEDIRIGHMFDKFVDFRVLLSRYSVDAQRGRIRGVTLRRIQTNHDPYNTVSLIGGYDDQHLVEDVRFEDVRIGSTVIATANDLHLFTRNVRGLVFIGDTTAAQVTVPRQRAAER